MSDSSGMAICGTGTLRLSRLSRLFLFSILGTTFLALGLSITTAPASVANLESASADEQDAKLQRAAENALAAHAGDGTIVVMDPQTGRIRASANSRLAFEEAFVPGSTIKPFVTLTALQTGLIDSQFRLSCTGGYSHRDYKSACSHPPDLPSLNAVDALSYSCNHFFGSLGERLNQHAFDSLLADFGFGEITGSGGAHESTGQIANQEWQPQDAMGNGEHLLVTPIQLLTAYAALVNGGHLFKPMSAVGAAHVFEERRHLMIDPGHRALIIEGMRDAVRSGTAKDAQLGNLPLYIFGKTGTSTEAKGFRTQGWFVGFASVAADSGEASSRPENLRLAVIVFLKRAHGAQAAITSRTIFEQFANASDLTSTTESVQTLKPPSPARSTLTTVRLRLVKENRSIALPLEEYVARVVAAEGSLEQEPEALKALAVVSRTYALKNLGRHDREGYDFCSTTHCQRFSASPSIPRTVREVVGQTTGETLRTHDGEIVDAYFGASCGGATANIHELWGVQAPPYLTGVKDDYCATMPHAHWTDVISSADLLRALQRDPRSNVGNRLTDIRVVRRDGSGRAQTLMLDGQTRRMISGWEFKIIVGRSLGWELIKSSRFDVKKSAAKFVFVGSGFGHGLGLCQEGAHVMARRGANYHEILAKYFPGTSVNTTIDVTASADMMWGEVATKASRKAKDFRQLSSENFRVTYPTTISTGDAERLIKIFESNRKDLTDRVSAFGARSSLPIINVFVNDTTGNFVGRTGQPPWAAAATKGTIIELQPLAQLERRGILRTTVRHELVHAIVKSLGNGQAPHWLEEGFALYMAGEGPLFSRYHAAHEEPGPAIERLIELARTQDEMRVAYAAAYEAVSRMVVKDGEPAVWRRLIEF